MSDQREPEESRALVQDLTRGLQATSAFIQSLSGEIRDNSVALAAFTSDLKNLRETVNLLSKILKDGNGKESLLTRTSILENDIEDLKTGVKDLVVRVENWRSLQGDAAKETTHNAMERGNARLNFWGPMIASILALAGTVVTLIIK